MFHVVFLGNGITNRSISDVCPYTNEIKLKATSGKGVLTRIVGETKVPLNKDRQLQTAPRMMIPKNFGVVDTWYDNAAQTHEQTFPATFDTGTTLYGTMRTVYPIWLIDHTGAAIKYTDDDQNDQTALQPENGDTITVGELRTKSDRLKDAVGCVYVKGINDISIADPAQGVLWDKDMDSLILGEVTENTYLMFLFKDDVTV